MEEIKPAQVPTPTTAQIVAPLHPKFKKRPLDSNVFAQYSKMRAVLRDLRPHFLEVLKTPDFRNSKASHEIREKIKLLLDLNKQTVAASTDTLSVEKTKNVSAGQSVNPQDHQQPQEQHRHVKSADNSYMKASQSNNHPSSSVRDKQRANDDQISGAYIVGGSAFGWNFITFSGRDPVYYGVTKEVYREKNPIISPVS